MLPTYVDDYVFNLFSVVLCSPIVFCYLTNEYLWKVQLNEYWNNLWGFSLLNTNNVCVGFGILGSGYSEECCLKEWLNTNQLILLFVVMAQKLPIL